LKLVEGLKSLAKAEDVHLIDFKELTSQQLSEMIDKGIEIKVL
jgi:hypothetical protein